MYVRSTSHRVYNVQVYKVQHSKSKHNSQYCQPNSVLLQLRTQTYTRILPFVLEISHAVLWHGFSFDETVLSKGLNRSSPTLSNLLHSKRLCSQVLVSKFVLYRKLSLWLAGFSMSTPLANQIYSHSTNLGDWLLMKSGCARFQTPLHWKKGEERERLFQLCSINILSYLYMLAF